MAKIARSMSLAVITILILIPSTQTLADTVMLSPTADASIYEGVPDGMGGEDYFANGSGQFLFMGRTGENNGIPALRRRSLIRFDLSGLSPTDLINSVSVSFQINNVAPDATADSASLHRLTADWSEGPSNPVGPEGQGSTPVSGDVTWIDSNTGATSWQTLGGDFITSASATEQFATGIEPLDFINSAASG